ncbi:MAG: hypothetical protein LBS35_13395 [Synergistaceae bacterium]|jgi:hypothetical protein|nr:hypothetical protein [Synergistaceae bacterium]
MGKTIFDADDIHKMRLEVAEQYAKMTKEEAIKDMREHAENTRRAIEEIRRTKAAKAV